MVGLGCNRLGTCYATFCEAQRSSASTWRALSTYRLPREKALLEPALTDSQESATHAVGPYGQEMTNIRMVLVK